MLGQLPRGLASRPELSAQRAAFRSLREAIFLSCLVPAKRCGQRITPLIVGQPSEVCLDRQEHELEQDAERLGETAGLAAHAEAFCQRVREGLAGADFDRKRGLLELLVDRVIVTDGSVEIRYVVPTSPDGEREPFWRLRSDYRGGNRPMETGDR